MKTYTLYKSTRKDKKYDVYVEKDGKILNRQTGNGILNKASKGTIGSEEAALVCATVWDVIPYEYFMEGTYERKYTERFSFLSTCVSKITNGKIYYLTKKLLQNVF